jgi:hypothetical protein
MIGWHIEIVVFNVDKKTRFSIKATSLNKAKRTALQEFKKQSPEKKNLYLEANGNEIYTIVSNLDDVGEVRIKCISDI